MSSPVMFSKLPEEVVDEICSGLDVQDINSFRMTCRDIRDKADRQWVAANFQTFTCIITKDSLQSLIDIASDVRFGARIKHLVICTVTTRFPKPD
jgi:hypothetical protein